MPKPRSHPVRARIAKIRRSVQALERSLAALEPALAAAARIRASGAGRGRRPRLSAKGRAALKLQGRYMGYMRHLKPSRKTEVRRVREAKGVRAAIRRARRLLRGSPP